MYKIIYRNNLTNITIEEYGFTRYIKKRSYFLKKEIDSTGKKVYEVKEIIKLNFSIDFLKNVY